MDTVGRPSKGFTLIEMVAVIATIGVLAAMIFPVFARAREQARSVICAGNLHEIGMALQMYSGDWDGRYPPQEDNLAPIARRMGEDATFRCPSAIYAGLTEKEMQRLAKAKHIEQLPPGRTPAGQGQWTPVIADGVLLGSGYYYHSGLTNEAAGDALLAAEREASHMGSAHELYASGRVKLSPEAEWKMLIPRSGQRTQEDFPSEDEQAAAARGRAGDMRGRPGGGMMRGGGMSRGGRR